MNTYSLYSNADVYMGDYQGDSLEDAIVAMIYDAGYKDYRDVKKHLEDFDGYGKKIA